jgi:hypothetical protein
LQVKKDAPNPRVEIGGGDPAEKRRGANLVFDIHTRSASADCVDAWQVSGCPFQRVIDAVVVVLRITFKIRIPANFFRKNALSVDHSRAFSVRATEVESDTATVEMTSERARGFARSRHSVEGTVLNFESSAIHTCAEELVIEFALASRAVDLPQHRGNRGIAGHQQSMSPSRP